MNEQLPIAEKGAPPRCPETRNDIPCQKRVIRLSDGTWDHGGGHWFMSDDLTACMDAGHFDPANILSMTPLVHLDVPCPTRVTSPATTTEPPRVTQPERRQGAMPTTPTDERTDDDE